MNKLSFDEVMGSSWTLAKKYGLGLALFFLVLYILENAVEAVMAGPSTMLIVKAAQHQDVAEILEAYSSLIPAAIITTLLAYVLMVGVHKTALNIVQGKSGVDFQGYNLPLAVYGKVILADIVYSIVVGIGCMFCILPGIFLAVRLCMVIPSLLDDPDLPFFEAFNKSWRMTSGNFWTLLLLAFAFICINILGLLCCCIGYLFTIAMTEIAFMVVYTMLNRYESESETEDAVLVE